MEENKSNKTKTLSITMILLAIVIGFGFVIGFAQVTGGKVKPQPSDLPDIANYFFDEEGTLLGYYGEESELEIPAHYSLTQPQETIFEATSVYTLIEKANRLHIKEYTIQDISTYEDNEHGWQEYKEKFRMIFNYRRTTVGNDYDTLEIGEDVFSNTMQFTSIKLPDTLKVIGHAAFANCDRLTRMEIPEGVERIENAAFFICRNLEYVSVPDTVTYINIQAFQGCTSLSSIHIPTGIYDISHWQYAETAITEAYIPDNVTYISEQGFANNPNLKTVRMSNFIRGLSTGVFKNCPLLEEIEMPETLNYMYGEVFAGCTSLRAVTLHSREVPYLYGSDIFPEELEKIYVEDDLYDEYLQSDNWSQYADKICKLSERV